MAENPANGAESRVVPLIAAYSLDRARGCLLRDGVEVHLRPQAYHLLSFLADRRGILVEKDELIQHIWQGRAVGDDSLVQALRDVRQALGSEGRHLRTIRGRGYILDVPAAADVEHTADGSPIDARPRRRPRWVLPLAAVVLAMLALSTFAILTMADPRSGPPIGSVAVLPFTNDTGDPDLEYLVDGIAEALINSLARTRDISVRARSTVARLKGRDDTHRQIAALLSVEALVEGRVARRDDTLAMSLAVVDVEGQQLWGRQYTVAIRELASAQERIAADVAEALRRSGSRPREDVHTRLSPPDADAHLLYLRGRYYASRSNEEGFRKAIDAYEQAVAIDPTYAPAYSGLADAHRPLSIVGQVSSREAFARARAAASRALELDPDLADAHVAMGWIAFSHDWDWASAERELATGIALAPGSADAHRAYAHLLSNLGRHPEALVAGARARELDPRSPLTNALEGQFLFYAGRYDEAERRLRRTLEIEPEYWIAHQGIGRVQILRGHMSEAAGTLRRAVDLSGRSTESLTQLGYVLGAMGDDAGAREVYDELRERSRQTYVPAYSFAMIHNARGEDDDALRELERSAAQREVQATFIRIDTRWDRLRPDPRFVEVLRTVGLDR